MSIRKKLLITMALLICVGGLQAAEGPKGFARLSMGVGVTTPVNFTTFVDSNYISLNENVVAAPEFDLAFAFALPYGHFIGLECGYNIFPVGNAAHIDSFSFLTEYSLFLKAGEYDVPLAAGLGLVLFSNDENVSTGLAFSLRTGMEYRIGKNFFLGFDLSARSLMEFGHYHDLALITYQLVIEPKLAAGVRW